MSLHLDFSITNPWVKDYRNEIFYHFDRPISQNKAISIQIDKFDWKTLFSITLWWRDSTMDHKGVDFELYILGLGFIIDFYDKRHTEYY